MIPGARIQAGIEILDAIAVSSGGRRAVPADAVANAYFRARRYIGSKDRTAIQALVYGVLRHRSQLDWWLAHVRDGANRGVFAPNARQRVIGALGILEGWASDEISTAFSAGKFTPAYLSENEQQQAHALAGRTIDHPEQPENVRFNCPEWLLPSFRERFAADFKTELRVLNGPAPVDLRVNLLKGDRNTARRNLSAAQIRTEPTPLSPWGLRVDVHPGAGRPNLPGLALFKTGDIEIQDEGSQLAAALVDAKPGMRVCDFCSGAGGKSLALAAAMNNKGHLVACDVSAPRLASATKRLRRAGAFNVERKHLENERDSWIKRRAGSFDRVLIDAPCSGTGTWRRNPDARWTLTPQDVAELRQVQMNITASAARLVKPGGRLIYVTCSLLPEENERQAETFLAAQPEFTALPISKVWSETLSGKCPSPDPYLRLSPAQHGTDGFFVAVFERSKLAAEKPAEETPA